VKVFLFFGAVLIVGLVIIVNFANRLNEGVQIEIFFSPLYGAFLGVAAFALICATIKSQATWSRITLWITALLCLVLQGGCWGAATAFGNATGGGVDSTWWHNIMALAIVIFVVWSVVIGLMEAINHLKK